MYYESKHQRNTSVTKVGCFCSWDISLIQEKSEVLTNSLTNSHELRFYSYSYTMKAVKMLHNLT